MLKQVNQIVHKKDSLPLNDLVFENRHGHVMSSVDIKVFALASAVDLRLGLVNS